LRELEEAGLYFVDDDEVISDVWLDKEDLVIVIEVKRRKKANK
jgi:hypothetical protein